MKSFFFTYFTGNSSVFQRPQTVSKLGAKEAQELTRQLAKIGGNLNQLAKNANQGGNVPAQALQELQSEVAHIWQQLT